MNKKHPYEGTLRNASLDSHRKRGSDEKSKVQVASYSNRTNCGQHGPLCRFMVALVYLLFDPQHFAQSGWRTIGARLWLTGWAPLTVQSSPR